MFWRGVSKANLGYLIVGIHWVLSGIPLAYSSPQTWTHDDESIEMNALPAPEQVEQGALLPVEPRPLQLFSLSTFWDSYIKARDPYGKVEWGLAWQGQTPYERNALMQKVPASVLKVLTAAAALKYLGPHFQFENFFRGSFIQDQGQNILVYPQFEVSGDPTWGDSEHYGETLYTRIDEIVQKLKESGIVRLLGPIEIFTSNQRLLNSSRPNEWKSSWITQCYAAIPTPVTLAKNCASLRVSSANVAKWNTPGVSTPIVFSKKAFYQTSVKRTPTPILDSLGRVARYELTSGYAQTSAGYSVPVHQNEDWLRNLLVARLKIAGIQYSEKVLPTDSIKLALSSAQPFEVELHSLPLKEIIGPFLKWSLNLVGDRLVLEIAEKRNLPRVGHANLQVLADLVGSVGNSQFYDGSGLVPVNFIAPTLLYSFLSNLKNDFVFPELLQALPVSGKSGTLSNRLGGSATLGRVYAKTGTINGVVNLAGYYLNVRGEMEPFVALTRSEKLGASAVRTSLDSIVTKLVAENLKRK